MASLRWALWQKFAKESLKRHHARTTLYFLAGLEACLPTGLVAGEAFPLGAAGLAHAAAGEHSPCRINKERAVVVKDQERCDQESKGRK